MAETRQRIPYPSPVRRRVRGLPAALTLIVIGGCATGIGSQDGREADFGASPSPGTTLQVMGFGTGDEIGEVRHDRAAEALGIDVELSEGTLDPQAFLSAAAAGNPPDLVYAARDQIGTFASRGAILPLSACVEAQGIDTGAFVDAALDQVTFDGELYGVPEFNMVQITMANSDLLADAGLGIADVDGSDPDAVLAAAEAMTRGDGGRLSVIGVDSKLPEFLPLWAKGSGADLLSEDGRTAQLDDPAVVRALAQAVSVYDAEGGFPGVKSFRDSADFFGAGNQFATGELGAMAMEQWYVNVLNETSPDAPLAFGPVRGPDGEIHAFATGSAWAVPAGSDDPAAACAYAARMTETDAWVQAATVRAEAREADGLVFTGVLTGNEQADAEIRATLVPADPPAPWDDAIDAMYEANDHLFALPPNPADAEFETAWQDAVNRVLNGQQEPGEAMAQAQEEAQEALDEAWSDWDDR
ncbi:ABC transporter substrate-binding protein [Promicromonospora sukumoe]|uniref:ABC transporter substrate-binding protein n=1 Tax=Promicromonospora sukumoe TaxID=88382 RepID=UPI0036605C23